MRTALPIRRVTSTQRSRNWVKSTLQRQRKRQKTKTETETKTKTKTKPRTKTIRQVTLIIIRYLKSTSKMG